MWQFGWPFRFIFWPKTQIGTDFYRILPYLASQTAKISTRRRRDYREDAAVAADIAAVAAAIKADTEADTAEAGIGAGVAPS